jgi:hypothetical protein
MGSKVAKLDHTSTDGFGGSKKINNTVGGGKGGWELGAATFFFFSPF